MVAPKAPAHMQTRRRRNNHQPKNAAHNICFLMAGAIFLVFFCVFLVTSGDGDGGIVRAGNNSGIGSNGGASGGGRMRQSFHHLVEKYELKGYGATHPRSAFILVATSELSDPITSMTNSISSILSHTDRNRILVICAVFQEGVLSKEQMDNVEGIFDTMDQGTSDHWHGLTKHSHEVGATDHTHGQKIRVILPHDGTEGNGKGRLTSSKSVAASRRDAANYVHYLVEQHEAEGLKSPEEHILVTFIRPDSLLATDHWMDTVTHSLMNTDKSIQNHVPTRNAISFASSTTNTYVESETKSVNLELKPVQSHASTNDLSSSHGHDKAYPTPIVEGSVTSMALSTFLNFPVEDEYLDSHFAADLEMSFNLWLCADGIDMVSFLRAKTVLGTLQHKDKASMGVTSVVRLAHTWMGGDKLQVGRQVLALAAKDGYIDEASKLDGSLDYLPETSNNCRSFQWYLEQVNKAMKKELDDLPPIEEVDLPVLDSKGQKKLDVDPQEALAKKMKEYDEESTDESQESGEDNKKDEEKEEEEKKIPSKPLSDLNKELISTAKMVDLKYVDVTDDFAEFPHKGAMDEQDTFGYIHDEKSLHAIAPPINLSKDKMNQLCGKDDGNKKMLTKKVFVDLEAHEAANRLAEIGGPPRAKIFCLVYTIATNHDRIPAIRETWGQKCDGFMVGSDVTDRELGTVHIPHEGPEEYNNIWQKVRAMWSYIYDNYYEEYDWFHIGGDDLYVLVENMRLYLESEEIQLAANGGEYLPTKKPTKQLPLFLGRRFKEQGNENRIFNSGGSGYTMNKAALKALVVDGFPTCMPHLHTFAEDVMVAQCFRNKLEVYPYDTKDENGGERYMPFAPSHHLTYKIPKNKSSDWYANYSIDIKTGLDHCAAKSVAFHYIKGDLMKRMHALLYGHCKN